MKYQLDIIEAFRSAKISFLTRNQAIKNLEKNHSLNDVFIFYTTSNVNFSIDNLNVDPSFNFSNSLFNSELLNTQDDDSNDSLYSNLDVQCSYLDENQYINNFKNLKNISILSLNIQSLSSKFAEFQELI